MILYRIHMVYYISLHLNPNRLNGKISVPGWAQCNNTVWSSKHRSLSLTQMLPKSQRKTSLFSRLNVAFPESKVKMNLVHFPCRHFDLRGLQPEAACGSVRPWACGDETSARSAAETWGAWWITNLDLFSGKCHRTSVFISSGHNLTFECTWPTERGILCHDVSSRCPAD